MSTSFIIQGTDYIECTEAATKMWCSSKSGIYGHGLLNTTEDRFKTERIGRLGEKALSLYLNKPVDFLYKEYGDTGDLILERSIDIKTANRNYGKMLIQAENEYGKVIKLKSDYYVAAYCNYDNIEEKKAKITLVGWIERNFIINKTLVPAIRGLHKNYQICYNELKQINLLKNIINGK